jgi:hypothetical protein
MVSIRLNDFGFENIKTKTGCGSLTPYYRAGVPGQREPDSQSVWFCLILAPAFLLVSGTGRIFEVQDPTVGDNGLHFSIQEWKTKSL